MRLSLPRLLGFLRNLQAIGSSPGAKTLEGRAKGVPAIVLGAGPSAGRAIEAFKGLRGKALFLVVDSIYPEFVRRAGFEPDFVGCLDPQKVILSKFQGHFGSARLLFHPCACPEAVRRFERRVVWDCGGDYMSRWLYDGNWPLPQTSGLHLCLYGAAILKCDPIVLAGCEFGSWTGGSSHAEGVALAGEVKAEGSRRFVTTRVFQQMGMLVAKAVEGFRLPAINVTPEGMKLPGVRTGTMLGVALGLAQRPLFFLGDLGAGSGLDIARIKADIGFAYGIARRGGPWPEALGQSRELFREATEHYRVCSTLGLEMPKAAVWGEACTILRLCLEALDEAEEPEPRSAGERRLRAERKAREAVENVQFLTPWQNRAMDALTAWIAAAQKEAGK